MQIDYRQGYLEHVLAEIRFTDDVNTEEVYRTVSDGLGHLFPLQTWHANQKVLRLEASDDEFVELTPKRFTYILTEIIENTRLVKTLQRIEECMGTVAALLAIKNLPVCRIRVKVDYDCKGPLEAVVFILSGFIRLDEDQLKAWGQYPVRAEVSFTTYENGFSKTVKVIPTFKPGETRTLSEDTPVVIQAEVEVWMNDEPTERLAELTEVVQVSVRDKLPNLLKDVQRGGKTK